MGIVKPHVCKSCTVVCIDDGTRSAPVRFLTFGNSLIASDHVTDIVRQRLVERFGDGGRGYVLPDRLAKQAGRRVRTGKGTAGWQIHTVAQKKKKRTGFGVAGSLHSSSRAGDKVDWRLDGADKATLWVQTHARSPGFEIIVDGSKRRVVKASEVQTKEHGIVAFDIDDLTGRQKISVKAKGKSLILHGIDLLKSNGGIVFDTIGVPAADAEMYFKEIDDDFLKEQVRHMNPDVFFLMLGGNEVRSRSFGWRSLDEIEGFYRSFIKQLQAIQPEAICMTISPIDAVKAYGGGQVLKTRPEVLQIIERQQKVSRELGCTYFNLFEAMGGDGSFQRFHRAGLVHGDLVHPKGKGGDVLGQLIADALFDHFRQSKKTPRQKKLNPIDASTRQVKFHGLSLTGIRDIEQRAQTARTIWLLNPCKDNGQQLSCHIENEPPSEQLVVRDHIAILEKLLNQAPRAPLLFVVDDDRLMNKSLLLTLIQQKRAQKTNRIDCVRVEKSNRQRVGHTCARFNIEKAMGGALQFKAWTELGYRTTVGWNKEGWRRIADHARQDISIMTGQR